MTDLDPATISSLTALVIALLALLVALAQVIQQYLVTGQLIRLCDSVVFGPLPGQGRRVWQMRQFRFRVIYCMPRVSLEAWLSVAAGAASESYARGTEPLPAVLWDEGQVVRREQAVGSWDWVKGVWRRWLVGVGHNGGSDAERENGHGDEKDWLATPTRDDLGEASWASFCRTIALPCGLSACLEHVDYDADRSPSDLVTVPMQVSMRDVLVMALMSGMEITYASFSRRLVAMHGSVGSLTSAQHPVLGLMLHFLPRSNEETKTRTAFGFMVGRHRGFVDVFWLARAIGASDVASDRIQWRRRLAIRRIDELLIGGKAALTSQLPARGKSWEDEAATEDRNIPDVEKSRQQDKTSTAEGDRSPSQRQARGQDRRVDNTGFRLAPVLSQDGSWTISLPTVQEKQAASLGVEQESRTERTQATKQQMGPGGVTAHEDVGSGSGVMEGSGKESSQRSSSPRQRPWPARATDPEDPSSSFNQAEHPNIAQRKLLEYHISDRYEETSEPATKAADPDIRSTASITNDQVLESPDISPYWYSQINIRHGHWATPWHNDNLTPSRQSLRGCVMVALEALIVGKLVTREQIVFTDKSPTSHQSFQDTAKWMCSAMQGASNLSAGDSVTRPPSERFYNRTYPAYARNARGGVIASGRYTGTVNVHFGPDIVVPVLELAHSYDWQARRGLHPSQIHEQNVELMRIDAWLSYVGRLTAIVDGPTQLLYQMPNLVDRLSVVFDYKWGDLDLSASEGGEQEISRLATELLIWLIDRKLTKVEQLTVLVALLRTAKVCQCVRMGPDTEQIQDILHLDVQAHMV